MGPEIGHSGRLDDWLGVEAVATTITETAREFVFPGEMEWFPRELGDRTVRATSFDAHLRLQHDPLNWRTQNPVDWCPEESRTMVVVRFAQAGQPLPDEPWSLRVRGEWPSRRDRLLDDSPFSSKSLRTGRGWKHGQGRRAAESTLPKVPWERHDSVWVAQTTRQYDAENQMRDLQAQVGLFLLQTNTVPRDGEVRDGVVEYLRRTFRWRGVEDPDAVVYAVYDHLLKHKWWLDDRRAWRKLVRGCINGLIKSHRHRAALDPDNSPDQQGLLTVDQFARVSGMKRSKAYELITAGKVPTTRREGDGRHMISVDVAHHFRSAPRRSAILKQGRSDAAAQQWVYRQERLGHSLIEIAVKVMKS